MQTIGDITAPDTPVSCITGFRSALQPAKVLRVQDCVPGQWRGGHGELGNEKKLVGFFFLIRQNM